jgi:DNA-binding FadR family transcriptional regulator
VSHLYQLRAVLDAYAARCAATRITPEGLRRGRDLVDAGQRAFQDHNNSAMITADVEFHRLLVEEAGNPLLVESTVPIWRTVQRVMGEVLCRGDTPDWVWQDHARILDAVESGDQAHAEELARLHAEHGERLILDAMAASAVPDP